MGLLSALVLLPLAPVRAVGWLADQIADAAEKEYYDPAPVMSRLAALHRALEDGDIDLPEFERQEESLLFQLQRLQAAAGRPATHQ
jgi:gas vesicle protein GvpG